MDEYEKSLTGPFRNKIWGKFIKAIKTYELLKEGDKIAVCVSGGKDSMLMAKLFSILAKHSDFPFSFTVLVMDPGYAKENRGKIEENAERLHLEPVFFETPIFRISEKYPEKPCYICAKMRRGALYQKARELGCNKIALGHHFNDVIETTLISMFFGGKLEGMLPKIRSQNYEGMELIRPLYMIREEDIIRWGRQNGLTFLNCACSVTKRESNPGRRAWVKQLIKDLSKENPDIEKLLFASLHHLNISTFPGYKRKEGEEYRSYLEDYEKEENTEE